MGFSLYDKLNTEDFRKIYRNIRTVVVPSIWPETWGYVVSEALLNKRLVIASGIGGVPEQVESLEGTFLFQPGNSEQLAELMKIVRNFPKEIKEDLGSKNREGFLKKYDNKKTLQDFVKVLDRVRGHSTN